MDTLHDLKEADARMKKMNSERECIRNWWITEAMIRYGGKFVTGLGRLFRLADPDNSYKLKIAFPEYWDEYEEMVGKAKADVKREREL